MTPQHLDLSQLPDTLNRRTHHRRAQSETFNRFPDFDDDSFLDDVVFDLPPTPTLSSDYTNSAPSQLQPAAQSQLLKSSEKTHFRSLSEDAGFFEGLYFGASSVSTDGGIGGCLPASTGLVGPRHRYSNSMDGLTASAVTSSFEAMMVDTDKKAMGIDRLQELALIDPKKVKRILANRQSAARSKERKTRYTIELERKVQTLQTEATTLSAQVTMMQRDTTGLTTENKELKLRLQAFEQQAHLRDALNEALREEVQRLRKATGQIPAAANGSPFNRDPHPQFSSQQPNFDQYKHDQQQAASKDSYAAFHHK